MDKLHLKALDIPAEMFKWKPDEDDIKGLMETFKVTRKTIADALDIPEQRITAAITKPRKETYMPKPNPHTQSTRTLIMLYLNSGLWRKQQDV